MKGSATIDDLVRMPDDGLKYELVDGEILVSPAGMRHGKVAGKIFHLIATFLGTSPVGEVYPDNVDLHLPNGNVRSPDLFFVRSENLPEGETPVGFGEFLECGVRLVWLVDPETRTVVAYRSLSDTRTLGENDDLDGEAVLPGFRAPVSRLFA